MKVHELKDKVWIMDTNKPREVTVAGISYKLNSSLGPDNPEVVITYELGNSLYGLEKNVTVYCEEAVFASKQELFDSL